MESKGWPDDCYVSTARSISLFSRSIRTKMFLSRCSSGPVGKKTTHGESPIMEWKTMARERNTQKEKERERERERKEEHAKLTYRPRNNESKLDQYPAVSLFLVRNN